MNKDSKIMILGLLFKGTINISEFSKIIEIGIPHPAYFEGEINIPDSLIELYKRINEPIIKITFTP